MNNSLYYLLKADNYSSIDDLKARYKELMAIHHPDKGGKAEDFQRIKEAFDYLKDSQRKKEYDMQLMYEEEACEKAEEIGVDDLFQFKCLQCRGINALSESDRREFKKNEVNITKCEHCSMIYKVKV